MHSVESIQLNLPLCDLRPADAYQPRPPRKRTCLNGKLVYDEDVLLPDGASTLDCRIHDISEGGAKVILAKRQPLPPDLYLIVVKYCVAHWATVVWREFPARGLKFSKTYSLNTPLPDNLRFLRELWANTPREMEPSNGWSAGQAAVERRRNLSF
jgi:hypothetical protein